MRPHRTHVPQLCTLQVGKDWHLQPTRFISVFSDWAEHPHIRNIRRGDAFSPTVKTLVKTPASHIQVLGLDFQLQLPTPASSQCRPWDGSSSGVPAIHMRDLHRAPGSQLLPGPVLALELTLALK